MRARTAEGGPRLLPARTERGASAVEFALVLPVLIMLMFGAFTAALAYSDHLGVTNAVREGGRLGAAIDYSTSPSWASDVQKRVVQTYMNGTGTLTTSQVCVKLVQRTASGISDLRSIGSGCGTEPPNPDVASWPQQSCVVKVWAAKPAKVSLLVFPDLDFTLGARSVSYYGRAVTGGCTTS